MSTPKQEPVQRETAKRRASLMLSIVKGETSLQEARLRPQVRVPLPGERAFTNMGRSGGKMEDARNAKLMLIVKFKSRLSDDEMRRRYQERLPEFRKLSGLLQKFYFRDESTGEWGGLYLWDSPESLQKYLDSDLRKTIASAYDVEGTPRVERLSVLEPLRP